MGLDIKIRAFYALVKAGLWETKVRLEQYGTIDFKEVYRLADEQSVIGLVTAGIEQVEDIKVPQVDALIFVGSALLLEQRNLSMNVFIAGMLPQTAKAGINCVLVKGQGIAQCYMRPNWRSAGDIDLLVNESSYINARAFFDKLTEQSIPERKDSSRKHLEYTIGTWLVELHGTMRTNLSKKIDSVIDKAQNRVFDEGEVRGWENGNIKVILPSPDNDVIFIFTHILQHFFRGGIGLRQLCDLARLLWTHRNSINRPLLKQRLEKMGVMTEWKAFGYILVEVLGLQKEAMPFYDNGYKNKAARVLSLIMESGNFGHNNDYSYFTKYPTIIKQMVDACNEFLDNMQRAEVRGILYKNLQSDWEDLEYGVAMKKFRKIFRDNIKLLAETYNITFSKEIPKEY